MAVTSTRVTTITFTGDVFGTEAPAAASNASSVGEIQTIALAIGANTITVPSGSGLVVTACTIIPPAGNTNVLTLKGVAGDTGIVLHPTDPTSLAIGSGVTSFVINVATAITQVRFIWS